MLGIIVAVLRVNAAKAFRDEQFNGLANQFFAAIAEEVFCFRVEKNELTLCVGDGFDVVQGLGENSFQKFVDGFAAGFLSGPTIQFFGCIIPKHNFVVQIADEDGVVSQVRRAAVFLVIGFAEANF
jgi:hypothetical protein